MLKENEITIRDACYDDVEGLTLLINELGYTTTLSDMENRFKNISAHADYRTIVAVKNDEIVGMAGLAKGIFYEKNEMYLRIVAFVVKQDFRKQGIAKLLIRASEDWAKEQGACTVLLNSGNRDKRQAAYAFYQKMGYVVKSSGFVKEISAAQ
jgi:GNAT superfamily N-acetyltransferase